MTTTGAEGGVRTGGRVKLSWVMDVFIILIMVLFSNICIYICLFTLQYVKFIICQFYLNKVF